MKNFNHLLVLVDAVVNADRRMEELANFGQARNRCAQARKILQKLDMIKKRHPKSLGCCWIVRANVIENDL